MPVQVTEDRGVVIVRYEGAVSVVDVEGAVGRVVAHEAFGAGCPTLWDISRLGDGGLACEDMRTLVSRLSRFRAGREELRVAVLAEYDVEAHGPLVFVGHRSDIAVFKEEEDALAWLRTEAGFTDA